MWAGVGGLEWLCVVAVATGVGSRGMPGLRRGHPGHQLARLQPTVAKASGSGAPAPAEAAHTSPYPRALAPTPPFSLGLYLQPLRPGSDLTHARCSLSLLLQPAPVTCGPLLSPCLPHTHPHTHPHTPTPTPTPTPHAPAAPPRPRRPAGRPGAQSGAGRRPCGTAPAPCA